MTPEVALETRNRIPRDGYCIVQGFSVLGDSEELRNKR